MLHSGQVIIKSSDDHQIPEEVEDDPRWISTFLNKFRLKYHFGFKVFTAATPNSPSFADSRQPAENSGESFRGPSITSTSEASTGAKQTSSQSKTFTRQKSNPIEKKRNQASTTVIRGYFEKMPIVDFPTDPRPESSWNRKQYDWAPCWNRGQRLGPTRWNWKQHPWAPSCWESEAEPYCSSEAKDR